MMMKTCTLCKNEFPPTTEFFYKHLDGLKTRCKTCYIKQVLARPKKKRPYVENRTKEQIKIRNRKAYLKRKAKIAEQAKSI